MTPHTVFANGINCFTGKPVGTQKRAVFRPPPALNRDQVRVVRAEHLAGAKNRELAARHHIARNTVYQIVHYRGAYASLI